MLYKDFESRKALYANQSTWRRTEPLMTCCMAVSSVRHGGGYVMAWVCMAATGIFFTGDKTERPSDKQ